MDANDPLKQPRWELLWAVQRSQRYHARRNAFFDRWHKVTLLVGVLGGSAVVASLGKLVPQEVALVGASLVAVLSGLDLVVGTGEMARKHNDLRRRFCEMEREMQLAPNSTEQQLAGWRAERLSIEADEPPSYVVLDLLCENELIRATGHLRDQSLIPLTRWQRVTAHFLRWENA